MYIVWDLDKARPMLGKRAYRAAARMADKCEDTFKRPFLVLPAQDDDLRRPAADS